MLLAFRFLSGLAGVATITCGSGTIADVMPLESRGKAMAIYCTGPLMGPVIGPIAAICVGVVTIIAFIILRETYPITILERKAAALRKSTGNPFYTSRLDSGLTRKALWGRTLLRPLKLLFCSPICAAMCGYTAVMYDPLYILFTTFTFVFSDVYHFSTSIIGLTFLGSGVGMFVGLAFVSSLSDSIIKRKQAAGEEVKPEDRLPRIVIIPASLNMPVGLIIYGWATEKVVHWIVPMIGTAIIGFGNISILTYIQTYLVDAFGVYAACAIAANAVLRSLLGALLHLGDCRFMISWGWGGEIRCWGLLRWLWRRFRGALGFMGRGFGRVGGFRLSFREG
ncbi:MFS transporter, partial [Lachnellula suecica]